MIRVGRKEISQININEKNIAKVYAFVGDKLTLIWEAIRSCFGSGFWINKRPWINKNAWKNK